jgi:uncharacterized protein YukE
MADHIKYAYPQLQEYAQTCQQLSQVLTELESDMAKLASHMRQDAFRGRAGDRLSELIATAFCVSAQDLAQYVNGLGQRVNHAAEDMKATDSHAFNA